MGGHPAGQKIFTLAHRVTFLSMQDKANMTDDELVHLVRSGDVAGLSFVYEKYRKEFISWVRKFSGCSLEDAQEYYQATTVILYENIISMKVSTLQSSLKTYLFGIGKNLTYQHHRKQRRLERAKAEYMIEAQVAGDTTQALQTEHDLQLVSRCLSTIGEPCRQLLDFFYFSKKSMEEISSAMGYKNPETAKNQKYKCMERLRRLVEDERKASFSLTEDQ
jgi:RNA polymerase sigma factor (sigma-70 family)